MNEFFQWFLSLVFGSDELTPYTAEYAWSSNQMAHAMMGFCLGVCWLFFVIAFHPGYTTLVEPAHATGVLQRSVRWLQRLPMDLYVVMLFAAIPLKELVDILLDASRHAGAPVDPNLPRLIFDSVTDIAFWWSGMFLAALVVGLFVEGRVYRVSIPLVGLVACIGFWLFFAGPVWLHQKRTFDQSGMPFNYTRLTIQSNTAEVAFDPKSSVKWPELEQFRSEIVEQDRLPVHHYVIIGGSPTVRTRLAVGMGAEVAFKLRWGDRNVKGAALTRVKYGTAAQYLEKPALLTEQTQLDRLELVIIDDLDVSMRLPSYVVYLEGMRKAAQTVHAEQVPVPDRVLHHFNVPKEKLEQIAEAHQDRRGVTLVPPEKFDAARRATNQAATDPEDRRMEEIIRLGALTQPDQDTGRRGISTIWVLAGYDGGDSEAAKAWWEERQTSWLGEIATILDIDANDLRVIRLADSESSR